MECFIVSESDIDQGTHSLVLRGDEARHAIRVLRLREGEMLMATTLNGICYQTKLVSSDQPFKNDWIAHCHIEETLPEYNEPTLDVQLIQGITQQQSKFEEIVEKVTEIGISSIIPIYSRRTEKKAVNRSRLLKIIQNACKQTYRARMPFLGDVIAFEEALEAARSGGRKIFVLHESAPLGQSLSKILHSEQHKKIALVIGPEGGFEESEVLLSSETYGAQVASLGPRRLRAETAAIAAVAVAMGSTE